MAYFRKKPVKKFVRKVRGRAVAGVRNRYITKGRVGKGYNIPNIIKDVSYIKRALNTERKHLDTLITNTVTGSLPDHTKHPTAVPHDGNIIIYPLAIPVRGTSYNNRIGNQIKVTNISVRYILAHTNTSSSQSNTTIKCLIFFAKNADDIPSPTELFQVDANGLISPASYWNSQEYRNFFFPKGLKYQKTSYNKTLPPGNPGTTNSQAQRYYPKTSVPLQTRITYANDSNDATMMKPYIMFISDALDATTDPIKVDAQIRLTYVDN